MGLGFIHRTAGNRLGLVRGERFVAATGVAFISTLIVALVAMGWFTTRSIEQTNTDLLESSALHTAKILAAQSEIRLQENDLAGLRRLMLDAGSSGGIEHCSIMIPDMGVIASTDANEVTIESLDEITASLTNSNESLVRMLEDGRVEIHEPLRGSIGGVLEVTTVASNAAGLAQTVRTISVMIGAAGMLVTLWIYRRFRSKLGGVAAVSESLLSFHHGERRAACLRIGEAFGNEAIAWNTILAEREAHDELELEQEIREALASQRDEGVGLSDACNALNQGVVVADHDLHVLYANGAARSFLGLAREADSNASLDNTSGGSKLADLVRMVLDGLGGNRRTFETGDLEQGGDSGTVLRYTVAKIKDVEESRVILMIEDITQQRLSDDSRNSLMAQATHELRTPLTNIKLYVEEAIEAGKDDEVLRDAALNVINKETRRLERVISDMMSVSEIEAGSLSIRSGDLRIGQLVEDLMADYQPQAKEKSIDLQFDLPPKMPVLQADRDRIAQALHNLIGNAIKYTPNGGRVGVEFEFDDDDNMKVSVSDSGIGIDPAECERIFEKFYRADDRRINDVTGSGLGLALAREIARLHGGDITVESEIDQGSVFIFTLPSSTGSMRKAA